MMTTLTADSARNAQGTYAVLPLSAIAPSPLNPRDDFDPEYIAELAENISQYGLLQPITVRPRLDDIGGYYVVLGECRYRACLQAGWEQIPVFIRECSDEEHVELAIIENLKRRDVSHAGKCPHYRGSAYHGTCLDPACFKTKEAEAVQAEQARVAQIVAETTAAPEDPAKVVNTSALKSTQFELLSRKIPDGCRPDCEKRVIARQGQDRVPICLDPACHARLTKIADERKKVAKKNKAEARCTQLLREIQDGPRAAMMLRRSLALTAARLCTYTNNKRQRVQAAEEIGFKPAVVERLGKDGCLTDDAAFLTALENNSIECLAAFCGYLLGSSDLRETITSEYHTTTPLANWLLRDLESEDGA